MPQLNSNKPGRRQPKVERLEARVTRAQKSIIARAAELRGTTVTDFLVLAAQAAAAETIREFEGMSIRREAQQAFVEALLHPPNPNAAARAAFRRYKAGH